ncbi:uncharacterized protein L969DRAFT_92296 [Mixia osmundae IAM 14324]|uniref:Uncharacterized protein n=1 Tax=Mixia osmundae (strain CBS 9802 / IAM 14324 / JCM 22182 / KY 12970) TaxID=764103 RepID=G7DTD7_MIXOS|nr:uncharacterized protein L969DRAFT_92296 [Mixia osmundae IAM 14324]KEI42879.1 hypothetical protein L969DRAFT_92296 [Mixia osmundae IAM 14324]GAA93784.1 hypothetical protein E5Q_00430 [Mixia osmundae IAM 14324]
MSSSHYAISVGVPIYSLAFTGKETVVLGGGGGSSKSGIKNKLIYCRLHPEARTLDRVHEYELPKTEDAPMSMAVSPERPVLVAGINESVDKINAGSNNNLRVFAIKEDSGLEFESARNGISVLAPEFYQKATSFAPDGSMLAIGNTNDQFSIYRYPSLSKVFRCYHFDGQEVIDADFSEDGKLAAGTSDKKVCFFSTETSKIPAEKPDESGDEDEAPKPHVAQTIERPVLQKDVACSFRSGRFGRKATSGLFYTIVNSSAPSTGRKRKRGDRKAFVSIWDLKTWQLIKTRTISQTPVTSFDISPDGSMLAFGTAELAVGVLDAKTLRPRLTILRAHDFAITALRFNTTSDIVVSGSVDSSIRVIPIDATAQASRFTTMQTLLLTLLFLLVAILVQYLADGDLLATARQHLHF